MSREGARLLFFFPHFPVHFHPGSCGFLRKNYLLTRCFFRVILIATTFGFASSYKPQRKEKCILGVSTQDRTDFLNMLDACRTEQQLFSRLTFAVMFHQTDPDAREDLLDDVRGAACNMQLPAVT